jgi:hypothetical protein
MSEPLMVGVYERGETLEVLPVRVINELRLGALE